MKIGVMMRAIGDQKNAPGIIVLNLIDHLLQLDKSNEYILFFKDRTFIDRYSSHPNVKVVLIPAPSKFIWDQVAIPLAVRREQVDLLFHPKHSLPLLANCKTLMHLRGSEYFTQPDQYKRLDLLYQKTFLPKFCTKATRIIVESEFVKRDFIRLLSIQEQKMTVIYLAPSDKFRVITDIQHLERIKTKYRLPSTFFLTVTRIVEGNKYYSGKNLINSIKGFQESRANKDSKFVIVGKYTKKFVDEHPDIPEDMRKNIIALDFVPQEDLPPIYNMAKFFLFPSYNESFGIPITEAMACGCPVITSTTTACPEIVGQAGILVDPGSIIDISNAIDRLNHDAELREELSRKGLTEAQRFNWRRSAKQTLDIIDSLSKTH